MPIIKFKSEYGFPIEIGGLNCLGSLHSNLQLKVKKKFFKENNLKHSSEIVVIVHRGFLNDYISRKTNEGIDKYGDIDTLSFKWICKDKKLLKQWRKKGFPDRW